MEDHIQAKEERVEKEETQIRKLLEVTDMENATSGKENKE